MASQFKTVSGLSRKPSVLLVPVSANRSRSPGIPLVQQVCTSGEGDRCILEWQEDDIAAWLAELGFQEYQVERWTPAWAFPHRGYVRDVLKFICSS